MMNEIKLEGTHRVRTHAALLTFDLSTPKPRISQLHVHQVRTLWDHSFLSYAAVISVKNAIIDPVTLTFDLSVPNPYHF